jgi:alkylation response protein AidB-like acyl-CoA dehydrogenase
MSTGNIEAVCRTLSENAQRTDVEGAWPERSVRAIGDAGLLSLTLSKEFGGAGAGMREFANVTRQLSKGCASTAMIYLMHVCAAQTIAALPHKHALKRIASEQAVATLAFSEKGSRSHFWAPVSRAHQNGAGIDIDAEKSFVTSAGHADYYVVSAGSIGGKTPVDSTLYLVERNNPGVTVSGTWAGLGLRGNSSAPMRLKCKVEESARLTDEGGGFGAMMQTVLPWFQVGSAAVSAGICESAIESTVQHVSSARLEHLDQSLAASLPGIRARLAQMQLTSDSARAYIDQTLGKIESGAPDAMINVLGVKAVGSEAAIRVTDEAMRACGGAAFSARLPIERNFRDARAASIMAPTTEVLYDFIGKALAGLPLF